MAVARVGMIMILVYYVAFRGKTFKIILEFGGKAIDQFLSAQVHQ
jgi:hypothetical protein